jgi:hypothetical protein
MKRLECRPSRIKLAGLLVLNCLMMATCVFCATRDEMIARLAGWVGVAFFSLGFITLPRAWLRAGQPVIIVGEDGIEDRQLGVGFIPWSDVVAIISHPVHGTKLLSIHVNDASIYLSRLSPSRRAGVRAQQALGFAPITLGFVGLTPGFDEVQCFLMELGQNVMEVQSTT